MFAISISKRAPRGVRSHIAEPTTDQAKVVLRRRSPLLPLLELGSAAIGLVAITLLAGSVMGPRLDHIDFDVYYFAAQQERHGSYTDLLQVFAAMDARHVYHLDDGAFGSPTLIALVFQPLSYLPLEAARITWVVLSSIAVVSGLRKAIGRHRFMIWFLLAIATPTTLIGLMSHNASTLTLACLAYCYGALRCKQSRAAGITLGIATAFKLYPAFLLVVFLVTRNWRAIRWASATIGVLFAVTVPALGWADTLTALDAIRHVSQIAYASVINLSLPGALLMADFSQESARVVSLALLATGVLGVFLLRKIEASLLFAIAGLCMLLAQLLSWSHYFSIAILVMSALQNVPVPKYLKIVAWLAFSLLTGVLPIALGWDIFSVSTAAVQITGAVILTTTTIIVAVHSSRRPEVITP